MKDILGFFGIFAGPIVLAFLIGPVIKMAPGKILYYEGLIAFWIGWYGVYYGLVDDTWDTDKKLRYFGLLTVGMIFASIPWERLSQSSEF